MTVAELIEKLKQMPQDAPVYMNSDEGIAYANYLDESDVTLVTHSPYSGVLLEQPYVLF